MGPTVQNAFFDNYTPVSDIAMMALCFVMYALVLTSYVTRTRSYRIFMVVLGSLVLAGMTNVSYNMLLKTGDVAYAGAVYAGRITYHAILYFMFVMFSVYIGEVTGLDKPRKRAILLTAAILAGVMTALEITFALTGHGFRFTKAGVTARGINLFMIGYLLFIIMQAVLLVRVRHLLYKRVMNGFFASVGISLVIMILQQIFKQSSFTTVTFLFPVVAMFYLMHSNPFNAATGTVDSRAMQEMVRYMHTHRKPFVFLSLYLPEFEAEGKKLPDEIQATVRRFATGFFRGAVLFQVRNGHLILMVPKILNPDYEHRIQNILSAFRKQYAHFRCSYKIVVGESMEEISEKNEYVSLIRNIHRDIPDDTVHRVSPDDIRRFNRSEYILQELTDIYTKKNLNDPRVRAYCQPVFNIQTGRFDTAEALMRLELDETGLVYPDQFIPMAEAHGYIHVLTEIILHKTCQEIRKMSEEGFDISRISVNVSVLELKEDDFCGDITRVIDNNHINGERIAIELTESRSEADFMVMKEKIEELRGRGIKFYLDDFGTGYSNMERIMELPFDIIKFDRSLVIASGADERSEKIVENLANMFKDMDYSVLYEGVEDDKDEKRCREMAASYLQGYKYSRPVPIEKLRNFLPKAG